MNKKCKVAIIGTGNIGTDLLMKIGRSPYLECIAFLGRRLDGIGIQKAKEQGIYCSDKSIQYIVEHPKSVSIVFDATSAKDHSVHAPILSQLGIKTIDLTPAKLGMMVVPAVNIDACANAMNVNMITCGGQVSIPIAYAISQSCSNIEYIEVVSSIASKSAGHATRLNLDEYIETTEYGLRSFSGAKRAKAILNLNPAEPCIDMQTTIFAKVNNPRLEDLTSNLKTIVTKVNQYVPGYAVIVEPFYDGTYITLTLKTKGIGDYLPEYAGNLDVINCAAIAIAEQWANRHYYS